MKKLLSIGQFAQLCRTTKDTLIHYDNIDLLPPRYCSAKNHRYYSPSQYCNFFIIQLLRDLGISLNEIKKIVTCRSLSDLSYQLKEIEKNLKQKLTYLEYSISMVENMQKLFCNEHFITHQKPAIFTYPNSRNLFVSPIRPKILSCQDILSFRQEHIDQCIKNSIFPFPMGCIISQKNLPLQNSKTFLFSSLHNDHPNNRTFVRSAGKYAAILHKGSFDTINTSIILLTNFISEQLHYTSENIYITFYDNIFLKQYSPCYLIEIAIKELMPLS